MQFWLDKSMITNEIEIKPSAIVGLIERLVHRCLTTESLTTRYIKASYKFEEWFQNGCSFHPRKVTDTGQENANWV